MIVTALGALLLAGAAPQEANCGLGDDTPAEAKEAAWYINNDPIGFGPKRFVKYGLPRVIGVEDLKRIGAYQGVPVFMAKDDTENLVVYVFVSLDDCSYQPYQKEG